MDTVATIISHACTNCCPTRCNVHVKPPRPLVPPQPRDAKPITVEVLGLETIGGFNTPPTLAPSLTIELRAAARHSSRIQLVPDKRDLLDEKIMNNCNPTPPCPPGNCNVPPCMKQLARIRRANRLIYGWVTVTGSTMTVQLTMLSAPTFDATEWSVVNMPTSGANLTELADRAIASLLKPP